MLLVDSNVFMYAAGADHPNKRPASRFLEKVAAGKIEAAIDAEVLQEILHRYRSIGRWSDGREVYDLARRIVPRVVAITGVILDRTRALMDVYSEMLARDALHAAAVIETGAVGLCSFDRDFDRVREIRTIRPG
jgi:uncharacterized protein